METTICYFGSFDPDYSRNHLIRRALIQSGFKILECSDRSSGLNHHIKLMKFFFKEAKETNIIFVGVLGHYDVPLAWILAKIFGKKLIFDAFYSLYDTYILDRKVAKPNSFAAFRFYLYDWLSVRLADKVILDTKENIDFFVKIYRAKRQKFYELPVTADPDIFKPMTRKKNSIFTVGFYGSFMPLHGVENIVRAFKLINDKNINCVLYGEGPGVEKIKSLIKELSLEPRVTLKSKNVSYSQLPAYFKKIDLFLGGPFGSTQKAQRVVPAKIAESLFCSIPTIVIKTKATLRLLPAQNKNIIWLENNDPESIARKILSFKNNFQYTKVKIYNMKLLNFNSFKDKVYEVIYK